MCVCVSVCKCVVFFFQLEDPQCHFHVILAEVSLVIWQTEGSLCACWGTKQVCSVYLSVYCFVYMFIYLSVYLFICLSVFIFFKVLDIFC